MTRDELEAKIVELRKGLKEARGDLADAKRNVERGEEELDDAKNALAAFDAGEEAWVEGERVKANPGDFVPRPEIMKRLKAVGLRDYFVKKVED